MHNNFDAGDIRKFLIYQFSFYSLSTGFSTDCGKLGVNQGKSRSFPQKGCGKPHFNKFSTAFSFLQKLLFVLVVETVIEVVSLLAAFVDRSEFRILSSIGSRVERARVFVYFHSLRNVVILKVSVQC